jgi:hypothetical protein
MGILLCIAAFIVTFVASRRSLVSGLAALTFVGYFYGILRANFPEAASHFIFDSAVVAFFLVHLFTTQDPEARRRSRAILPWLAVLVAWPVLLAFIPLQDPLVQLVGLRANIFFLPFLLIGARMSREDLLRFAIPVAWMNLVAFFFAAVEYFIGIDRFYPHNSNTEIIYRSADVAGAQYRIPGIFTGSHAYAGAMVTTLPLLIGAWSSPRTSPSQKILLMVAILASILGVFTAASRTHIIVLAIVMLACLISTRITIQLRAAILVAVAIVAGIVFTNTRLQRISTLQDTNSVSERVGSSVNTALIDLVFDYPFGNGLGGGGSSLPYFLENRVRNRVAVENEYARILIEQTSIGLCLWIAFLVWFISRRFSAIAPLWSLTEELSWIMVIAYFGTAVIGLGLLTSIPQTMFLLLCAGAVTSWKSESFIQPDPVPAELAVT